MNISTFTFSWKCGEHSDVIVGKILYNFSFEITMTNQDALFDLMVAGSHPIFLGEALSYCPRIDSSFIFWFCFASVMCKVRVRV